MSTLHTNTIETSSGGPVTLTKQSAAKAWSYGNQTTIDDGFNISTATDNGVGLYIYNLTSPMSNSTYPVAGICKNARVFLEYEGILTTSSYGIGCRDMDTNNFEDTDTGTMINGYLA